MGYEVNLANIAGGVSGSASQVSLTTNTNITGSLIVSKSLTASTATFTGETVRVPPAFTSANVPAPNTLANRTNLESAIVAGYIGNSGTASYQSNFSSTGVHYMKKFFNMAGTTGGSFNQTLVEIDGRTTNFHELWIKITWGTRIQAISDSTTAMCERAFGCNKFNGLLINYNIGNNWSHIDGNSDSYMDINVVNSPTTGILLVQFQEASPTNDSSFVWGYIEMMSIETLSDGNGVGGIPVKFNC